MPSSPASVSVGPAQPVTTEFPVELERRFNDLRREFLDQEVQVVQRWLTALAIILTVLGLLFPIAAFLGFQRFREIEREAQAILKDIRGHEQEAQKRVDRIAITAEDAEENEEVLEKAQAATDAPGANLIDIAVADALTLRKEGRIKEAIAKWQAIANLVQDTDTKQAARAHFSVGYLYLNFGAEIQNESTNEDPETRAIRSFDEALRLQPDQASAYVSRGASKLKLKQYEASIADFDEAIRLRPDLPSAYHNRGMSNSRLGQHAAAVADFNEAIRLRPDNPKSYYRRGVSKADLEQYEAAIADFDEAIRLQPDRASAYHNRGIAKSRLGQHAAAVADLNEAIRLRPDHSESHNSRGVSKAELGQHTEAIADFDEAIRLQPDNAVAYEKRAQSKAAIGDDDGAASDQAEAAQLKADSDRRDSLSG